MFRSLCIPITAFCLTLTAIPKGTAKTVDFNNDIRPILSDNCFACHGPDEKHRKAKLRLDTQDGMLAKHDDGFAVVPGKPDDSQLVYRITTTDEDDHMPPKESGKALTSEQIAKLKQWITEGAKWEQLWSFVPVHKPEIPEVQDAVVRNPIDAFIVKRLQKEGLKQSPQADRETLIRRVTFDLTGLPPTPEEVDSFVKDKDPNAYENLVDRLLASKRYGEHVGRFWLDAARYGDTHGLHLDNYREIWPYRDWVVRAFNKNEPYNDFLVDQLAGDLLPNPTRDQLIATGFIRCHPTTSEGGSIEEEVYVRNVDERVITMGTVGLGLTFECTRCHDHKFDPLTQKDFFSMFAFFNNLDGPALDGNRKDPAPVIQVPSPEQEAKLAALDKQIGDFETKLKSPWPEVDQLQVAWEKNVRKSFEKVANRESSGGNFQSAKFTADYLEAEGLEADIFEADGFSAQDFKADFITARHVKAENLRAKVVNTQPQDTNAELAAISLGDWYTVGPFNDVERYLKSANHGPEGKPINLEDEFKTATGEKLKWKKRTDWADGKTQNDLPGDFAANFIYRRIESPKAQKIKVSLGSDDGIRVYLNGKRLLAKYDTRGVAPDQDIIDLPLKQGSNDLLIKIINLGGASGYYFALKSDVKAIPEAVFQIASTAEDKLTDDQHTQMRDYFRNQVSDYPELVQLHADLKKARDERNELDRQVPTTLVFKERKELKPAYILKRGEYDQRGAEVTRATPVSLPPMDPDLPKNRLGLAKWLTNKNHPLTSRVEVNRLWLQFFGTGIVKTAEDFGSQGEPPSHPQLLDWLAAQFMDDGWDIKQTVRRIVLSATYRQSSKVTPAMHQRDPENRLLARGPRFRLDAEMLRDQALYVSGMLVDKMGGPSVKPPQPDGLWSAVGYSGSNTVRFKADEGPDKVHRRTLYTFIKRTAPPPELSTFDAPDRESCTVRRERTDTPLQALLLMNDPQYVEAARALAQRSWHEGGETDAQRAARMYKLATCRDASPEEVKELVTSYQDEWKHYQKSPEKAGELLAVGSYPVDKSIDPMQLAAWTVTANMVLNLDEVIMKD
ncbi:DUF1553 domain-containing protein [bacterium]|nr:DUF1553 domain-containing protein [bacterium]